MKKSTKKSLAVVQAVEPKATETQAPKPEPEPVNLSVTARLAINYYQKSINILEGQIEFTARLSGARDAHDQRMADSEALANAMFLYNMLVDLDCTSATSEAEMVNAMLYQVEAAGFTMERPSTEASESKGEAA